MALCFVRLDANGFLGVEKSAEEQPGWSEGHPLSEAANQLIVAVNIGALSEAIVFLEAYGVDTDAALKVLGGGLAPVLVRELQRLLEVAVERDHDDVGSDPLDALGQLAERIACVKSNETQ